MTPDRVIRLRREAWGFAIGSLFFAVGAVPYYAKAVGPVRTNGALCFLTAALLSRRFIPVEGAPTAAERTSEAS